MTGGGVTGATGSIQHGYEGLELGRQDFIALAVTHPLAQPELSGESRLRHVLGRGPEGGLECATHIPANAAIEFTHQTPTEIVAASSRSVRMAVERLPSPAPRAVRPGRGRRFRAAQRLSAGDEPGDRRDDQCWQSSHQ